MSFGLCPLAGGAENWSLKMEILFKHKKDQVGRKVFGNPRPGNKVPKTAIRVGENIWCLPPHGEWACSTLIAHQAKIYEFYQLDSANVFSPTFEVL